MDTLKRLGFVFLGINEYGFKTWYNEKKDIIVEKTKKGFLVSWLDAETTIKNISELKEVI